MPHRTGHARKPGPAEQLVDCLAYAQAVHAEDDETAQAVLDVLRGRLAGRVDATVAPLTLAAMILDQAERHGSDVSAVLAVLYTQAQTGQVM